ncbi:methylglyoxal synthase [Pontivivens insulae]|uniref:Methylglyoxal synthase n=1 Tax=Pontivivens insulae TaxID=1639689 RepID=A0A2R8AF12_9RHOB|nr:methylglyoxal synthase [Pontivivens insulae]RED12087.1 methylglyoxal synthase [Pontivivens insulae]SPF30843.1 Methylglyoxal synthase [Pontivivens insulae]
MHGSPLRVALVAHDARKDALIEWAGGHLDALEQCEISATGTTGGRLKGAYPKLNITALKSGPLGGDQQIGALIAEDRMDAIIFFIDPLSPMPHDVDVKALTRLAVVYDLPLAHSPRAADVLMWGLRHG